MENNQRAILTVGGGQETLPGIRLAQSMGLHVIVSDANPNAVCMAVADDQILASTYDISATLAAVKHFHKTIRPIDGVICIATDVALTVATIAEELGLPGIPLESARIASDKYLMRDCFKANGLPIPWYSEIFTAAELKHVVRTHGFPLIVKPVDSRGSRGVLRLTPDIDLKWAYSTACSYSPAGRVIVEEYLTGPQVSTESLVIERGVYTIGFSDRNYEYLERYAPYIVENGGELPSILPAREQLLICSVVAKTANALGITNGVIKGDMVITDGKPYIIEVAARLSGGYFCSHEIPTNTGVDFLGAAIRLALGESLDESKLSPQYSNPVCQRYFFSEPGRVTSIEIPAWIDLNPNVIMCELRVHPGDILPVDAPHSLRVGVVITTGKTSAEAKKLAERVIYEVLIETDQV